MSGGGGEEEEEEDTLSMSIGAYVYLNNVSHLNPKP